MARGAARCREVFRTTFRSLKDLALVCSGVLSLVGCALDERQLHRLPAEAQDGADSGAGGAPTVPNDLPLTGAGGSEMDAGSTESPTRWSFEHDIDGWQAEADVEQRWDPRDVINDPNSGSLVIANTGNENSQDFLSVGTAQCLPVLAERNYDISAQVYIANGQSTGGGGFQLQYFDAPDCGGGLLGVANFLTATTGDWQLGDRSGEPPSGTRSTLFRLVASKILSDPSFVVGFDDVVFEPE